jgi:hypothetical protein
LIGAEHTRLPQHLIHQRRLAVIDVGDDGDVSDGQADSLISKSDDVKSRA